MNTAEIISFVRASLGDEAKNLILSDAVLSLTVSRLQRKWMIEYHTDRTSATVTMTTDEGYTLSSSLDKLLKVECADSADFEYRYNEKTNKLTVENGLVTGVTFTYYYYKKPIVTVTNSSDLEIGTEFRELLIEGVLTMYRDKFPSFRKIEDIEKDVESLAWKLRAKDRYQPILMGELDF